MLLSCARELQMQPPASDLAYSHKEALHWDGTMLFNQADNPFLQTISEEAEIHPNRAK